MIGIAAAIFTTSAFLPQAIKILQTKNTEGISLVMYAVFNLGVLLWLTYGIFINDLPLILANLVTIIFTMSILIMKIKYK